MKPYVVTVAQILLGILLVFSLPAPQDGNSDQSGQKSTDYDGTTYTFSYHSDPDYHSTLLDFQAGSDTFLRIQSRLEGYETWEYQDGALAQSTSKNVVTFVIPEPVKKMGSGQFEGYNSLTSVIFLGDQPEFVSTFDGAPEGLKVYYLSTHADSWETFTQCPKEQIEVKTYSSNGCSFQYCTLNGTVTVLKHLSGTEIDIPGTIDGVEVTYIGASSFFYDETSAQDRITSVKLGENIEYIGVAAFKYCEFLETVTLPSSLMVICDEAFRMPIDNDNWARGKIGQITFPDGLKFIGFEAFRMNYSLKEVTVPDTVTYIGDGAFRVCVSLESFNPGTGITKMEANLLQHDHRLTDVTIPEGVTEIGESCFGQCYALETLVIPDSVKSLGANVFQQCSSLREISCCDDIEIGSWCFSSTPIQTVTITSSTNSDNGFTAKYLDGTSGWTLPGQTGHLTLLVIDTADQMKMNAAGNDSGFIRLTEKSTSVTVGGTAMDAGKTYRYDSSWVPCDAGTLTVVCTEGDIEIGTASGSGTYLKGSTVQISVTPKSRYEFVGWSDGNTDNPRTVTVSGDAEYFAEVKASTLYTVTISVVPEGSAAASGQGTYVAGKTATLSVEPKSIGDKVYRFDHWSDGSKENPRTITVDRNYEFTAYLGWIELSFDTGSQSSIDPIYTNEGDTVVLPPKDQIPGKTIASWVISGKEYAPGQSFTVPDGSGNKIVAEAKLVSDKGNTNTLILIAGAAAAIAALACAQVYLLKKRSQVN